MKYIKVEHNGLKFSFKIEKDRTIGIVGLFAGDGEIPFPFHQVHIAGGDRNAHHGAKLIGASESAAAKYVSHREEKTCDGYVLEIVTASEKVEIDTEFRFFDGVSGFRVRNRVKNIAGGEICLEEVNAFSCLGIDGGRPTNEIFAYLPASSWYVEAQWKRESLYDLRLSNGNGVTSMRRLSVGNSGTWSTKEFLPMGIVENSHTSDFMLWQIESNTAWHYEIGDHGGKYYLNAGGPNYQDNGWAKKLCPGEVFEAVPCSVVFGKSLNAVLAQITRIRRRIHLIASDFKSMPVVFNSYMHLLWDYPEENKLKPIIDSAAELGCEVFCIDAGWHDEEDWWLALGDWEESKTRFPSGVKKTVDYIKSKGMRAGLWVEIEDVGPQSHIVSQLPEECFFRRNGALVRDHNRYILDFSHPLVRERSERVIDRMISLGADYIKMDYNVEGGNGTETGAFTCGEGLMRHGRAFLNWLLDIRKKYPQLILENCASGGCRMDYAMLSVCSLQSSSDQTDYLKFSHLCANLSSAVLPEQCGVWCYPCAELTEDSPAGSVVDAERTVFNVVNALTGRFYLSGCMHLADMHTRALVYEGIEYYKRTRDMKKIGVPVMPFGFSGFADKVLASGFRAGNKLYLAVWNKGGVQKVTVPMDCCVLHVRQAYPAEKMILPVQIGEKGLEISFNGDAQARFYEIDLF